MEISEVLNPKLFRLLHRKFGNVRVSNQGEAAQIVMRRNPQHRNREEPEAVHPGEYYQVCCPYCNDHKNRLYINHLFGQRDDEGNTFWHLAHCFNENCLSASGRVFEFMEDLTDLESDLTKFKVKPGKVVDISKIRMDWPGTVIRVDKLPSEHFARQYLISRKFDPDRIGRFYNVRYCSDDAKFWLASNRLIIPIYEQGRMIGWQARLIGNARKDGPPKYFTCPGTPRRMILYNIANAMRYKTGVIVEGPTDVWSFGPMACCCLGATMTGHQQKKFRDAFKDHSAVLLFDPEEVDKPRVQKLVQNFSSAFEGGFAVVRLPAGQDPGSLDRNFLRGFVRSEAKAKGVNVSWSKRDNAG